MSCVEGMCARPIEEEVKKKKKKKKEEEKEEQEDGEAYLRERLDLQQDYVRKILMLFRKWTYIC
jgi:hypothetical protein